LGRADLIADFLNSGASGFIEHGNDVAMTRHTFATN
jgi:hypothetical protein